MEEDLKMLKYYFVKSKGTLDENLTGISKMGLYALLDSIASSVLGETAEEYIKYIELIGAKSKYAQSVIILNLLDWDDEDVEGALTEKQKRAHNLYFKFKKQIQND